MKGNFDLDLHCKSNSNQMHMMTRKRKCFNLWGSFSRLTVVT